MHKRMRIAMAKREELLQAYIWTCDKLIAHSKKCPLCQQEEPCLQWDTFHVEFKIAESKSKLLGLLGVSE